MASLKPRCGNCIYWEPYEPNCQAHHQNIREHGDTTGNCRRHPPTLNLAFVLLYAQDEAGDDYLPAEYAADVQENYYWRWPATITSDWCGDFKEALGEDDSL